MFLTSLENENKKKAAIGGKNNDEPTPNSKQILGIDNKSKLNNRVQSHSSNNSAGGNDS